MNFYLYHHKSTEVLATESKTNDHSPCHTSNMDCSQVAGANIWLLVTFISNQGCSFFLKSTCSHRILSGFYTDFLKVIERQFDTQFKKSLSERFTCVLQQIPWHNISLSYITHNGKTKSHMIYSVRIAPYCTGS